jgi:hypothetical protein
MHAFKDHQRFQSGWPPQALTRAAERCLSLALLQRSLASPGSQGPPSSGRGPGLAGSAIRRRGLIGSRPYKILGGPRWPRRLTYQA